LRFGSRAKNIKNKAKVNKDETVAELKKKNADFEIEVAKLKIRI